MGSMEPTDDFNDRCQGHDLALDEPCQRPGGHEGPHDATWSPVVDPETPGAPEAIAEPQPVVEEPTQGPPPSLLGLDLSGAASVNLAARMQVRFAEAVDRYSRATEPFDYAVGLIVVPTPNGPQAGMGITMFANSVHIGEKIHGTLIVDNFYLDQDQVDQIVRDLGEELLRARATHAEQIKAQAQQRQAAVTG